MFNTRFGNHFRKTPLNVKNMFFVPSDVCCRTCRKRVKQMFLCTPVFLAFRKTMFETSPRHGIVRHAQNAGSRSPENKHSCSLMFRDLRRYLKTKWRSGIGIFVRISVGNYWFRLVQCVSYIAVQICVRKMWVWISMKNRQTNVVLPDGKEIFNSKIEG